MRRLGWIGVWGGVKLGMLKGGRGFMGMVWYTDEGV